MPLPRVDRRTVLAGLAASVLPVLGGAAAARLARPIPSSGERLPVIGMGSWITFDVGDDRRERAQRVEVLRNFFAAGGGMIDSSPMYGSSEEVIGHCLSRLAEHTGLFTATKVWTPFESHGAGQIEASRRLWGAARFDLMQVHNLLNWDGHLRTLRARRDAGQIRYIGVTTSHGRRHETLEKVMKSERLDFVQLTYNMVNRATEKRLLPLAAERGQAVIVNRPFLRGELFDYVEGHPLPPWAAEFGAANWAQFFLKWVISHPAVTCAIPATSRPDHMRENMGAGLGPLPDAKTRAHMLAHVEGL